MTKASGAITLDFKEDDIYEKIRDLTGGVAPMLALTLLAQRPTLPASFDLIADRPNAAPFMGTERPHVLCQAIQCCRDFGPVSLVGINCGFQQIMDALSDYLRPFVRARRERPGEDLISEIVGSVIDDEMLTEDEGVEASMVVLTGGFVHGLDGP